MLNLPNVTIACISSVKIKESIAAVNYSKSLVNFGGEFLYFEDSIKSKEDYSKFIICELGKYIKTSHVLIVQWDGFVINPDAWKNSFLDYDYIGSIWCPLYAENTKYTVGNGGFSLRSSKLMRFCAENHTLFSPYHPEDAIICRYKRPILTEFNFAPEIVACEFSGDDYGYIDQFGFHGPTHFPTTKEFKEKYDKYLKNSG